jgi:hypothetical protein
MIPQFIVAFLLASVVLIGGSLLWPKFMKGDRPPVLQAVHDKVIETDAGRKAEEVLGTYTIPNDIPQAVSSVSSQVATEVGSTVQKKVEEVVTTRIIEEVVKRFETLPTQQKEEVKNIICKPTQ